MIGARAHDRRATPCASRASRSRPSAPAAAASPGSTRAARSGWARRARARIPGPACYGRGRHGSHRDRRERGAGPARARRSSSTGGWPYGASWPSRRSPGSPPSSAPLPSRPRAASSPWCRPTCSAPFASCRCARATIRAAYTLVAFGGAGPLHAGALARDLGIAASPRPAGARDPLRAGAAGRGRCAPTWSALASRCSTPWPVAELAQALRRARAASAPRGSIASRPALPAAARPGFDLRYVGQNFELTVRRARRDLAGRMPRGAARGRSSASTSACTATPRRTSRCRSWRSASRRSADRELPPMPALPAAATADPKDARTGERAVYFEEARGFVATPGLSPRAAARRPPPRRSGDRRADGLDHRHPRRPGGPGRRAREPGHP